MAPGGGRGGFYIGPRRGSERTKGRRWTKEEDGRERRCWNQYVARSLAPSAHHHLSPSFLLWPEAKPLLLVSDFYLVAPGARFISLFSLSLSPPPPPPPPLLSPSTTPFSLLSPTNSPQPRTARNFLFRILDP